MFEKQGEKEVLLLLLWSALTAGFALGAGVTLDGVKPK
jgi:hypothetical protein